MENVAGSTDVLSRTSKTELRVLLFPEWTEFVPQTNGQEIVIDNSGIIISFSVTLQFLIPLIAEAIV